MTEKTTPSARTRRPRAARATQPPAAHEGTPEATPDLTSPLAALLAPAEPLAPAAENPFAVDHDSCSYLEVIRLQEVIRQKDAEIETLTKEKRMAWGAKNGVERQLTVAEQDIAKKLLILPQIAGALAALPAQIHAQLEDLLPTDARMKELRELHAYLWVARSHGWRYEPPLSEMQAAWTGERRVRLMISNGVVQLDLAE